MNSSTSQRLLLRHLHFVGICWVLAGCAAWTTSPADTIATAEKRWEWQSGIPNGIPRAEMIPAIVSSREIDALSPSGSSPPITLVSTNASESTMQISQISEKNIRNCAELCRLVDQCTSENKSAKVTFVGADSTGNGIATNRSANLEAVDLSRLLQRTAPQSPVMRLTQDGNPWIVVRKANLCLRLSARVERNVGMLQLIMSLQSLGGADMMLPKEVRATCSKATLRCMSVAETLELLYGRTSTPSKCSDQEASFASASEREDYLIPTNFKRLQSQYDENSKNIMGRPVLPALASVPGKTYPGSPILGDARALTAFLLQRQIYKANEHERTGWIVFAGESIKKSEAVEIEFDLGDGPQIFRFTLPKG